MARFRFWSWPALTLAAPTLRLAVATPPVPPSVETTLPVVLAFVPAVVPVTFREKVQDAPDVNVPPARLIVLPPAAAVIVPAPQAPVRPFGVATTNPAGRVSLKATPVSAVDAFGFVIVKVRLVLPPRAIAVAPKVLLI